jgi:hypothetical protein
MMHKTLHSSAVMISVVALGGCCGTASMSARASYGTAPPPTQAVVVQQPPPSQTTVVAAPPPEVHSQTTVTGTQPPPRRAEPRPAPQPTPPPSRAHAVTPSPRGHASVGVRVNTHPRPRPQRPTEDTPFGSTTPTADSLVGNIYFLPENTARLPNLLGLTPVGQVYTRRIDIPARNFEEGFPGVSDRFEWFAIRYTGTVTFPTAGNYAFRILSDDGARLYIDGRLVVDNDGQHAPAEQRGTIQLTPGNHEVVLEYFQGPRYQIALQLFMTAPGGQETIFSLE